MQTPKQGWPIEVDRNQQQPSSTTHKTGKLHSRKTNIFKTPSCSIVFSEGITSRVGSEQSDDGIDDSISSSKLPENAVLKGTVCLEAINHVRILNL